MRTTEHDAAAGLPTVMNKRRAKRITKFSPQKALEIVERVAAGETLTEICTVKNKLPSVKTFMKWVATMPDLQKAYMAAKSLSAMSMEEEALNTARSQYREPGSQNKIRAATLLIDQLRWSATRRDPKQYSEKGSQNIVVPIHINTSLDMGADMAATGGTSEYPDIYKLEAQVEKKDEPIDADFRSVAPVSSDPASDSVGNNAFSNLVDTDPVDFALDPVFDPDRFTEQKRREVTERFARKKATWKRNNDKRPRKGDVS